MKKLLSIGILAAALSVSTVAQAEELKTIFERVNKYVAENNYSKALSELKWAEKELEKMTDQIKQFQGTVLEQGCVDESFFKEKTEV